VLDGHCTLRHGHRGEGCTTLLCLANAGRSSRYSVATAQLEPIFSSPTSIPSNNTQFLSFLCVGPTPTDDPTLAQDVVSAQNRQSSRPSQGCQAISAMIVADCLAESVADGLSPAPAVGGRATRGNDDRRGREDTGVYEAH
jgi:hypothetical protein